MLHNPILNNVFYFDKKSKVMLFLKKVIKILIDLKEKNMTDLNIVDVIGRRVVLEKMGDVYWGICPFHVSKEEKESKLLIAPTMIVNKEESSFRCHKCDASGGPEDFLEMYEEN